MLFLCRTTTCWIQRWGESLIWGGWVQPVWLFHCVARSIHPHIQVCESRWSNHWLSSLVPVEGTLNASADQDILNSFMLPALWEQFKDDLFLFQHDKRPWASLMWEILSGLLRVLASDFPTNISVWSRICAPGRLITLISEELKLKRVGQHQLKPCGVRRGRHSRSYGSEGWRANTFGSIVYVGFKKANTVHNSMIYCRLIMWSTSERSRSQRQMSRNSSLLPSTHQLSLFLLC